MASGRKLMIWTIMAVLLLLLAIAAYFILRSINGKSIAAVEAVPPETVVLVKPLEIRNLTATFSTRQDIQGSLARIPFSSGFARVIGALDSLSAGEDSFNSLLQKNELLLAWAPDRDSNLQVLVLLELKDMMETRTMKAFLSRHFKPTTGPQSINGRELSVIGSASPFYFCISKGLFYGSPSLDVLNDALVHADKPGEGFFSDQYTGIMQTSGKNVDANIYVKTGALAEWYARYTGSHRKFLASNLGQFASLDLIIKENGLILNGFFSFQENDPGLKIFFTEEGNRSAACPSVLPDNTSEFLKVNYGTLDQLYDAIDASDIDAGKGEISPLTLPEAFRSGTGHEMTIAQAGDGDIVAFLIMEQAANTSMSTMLPGSKESGTVMGVPLYRQPFASAIGEITWPFKGTGDMPYCCYLDRYIIFADSEGTLEMMIRKYQLGKTLANGLPFQTAKEHVTDNSNLFYFANLERLVYSEEKDGRSNLHGQVTDEGQTYRHFPSFTAQFTVSGGWSYSSMALNYILEVPEPSSHLWKISLDNEIARGPLLIENPADGTSGFLVTDILDQMYMLSSSGELRWKRRMDGRLLGGVTVMTGPGAQPALLFNTLEMIYLLDWKGDDIQGFPVSLASAASAGLKLIKYPDNGTLRILVPCSDNSVSNFDIEGKKVKGWKEPSLGATPASTPEYLVIGKKDYLFFPDVDGNVLITDRKGKERIKIKGNFTNSDRSGIYVNKTNSKGLFLTTDARGHLVYIPEKGKVTETVFSEFSPDHYFFYVDMDGNGNEDFVYFDQRKLQVFDRFKKKMINAALPEEPTSKPLRLKSQSKQNSFLFTGASGTIYIVDSFGELTVLEDVISDKVPAILTDREAGLRYLAVTRGLEVLLHPLP